MLILQGDSWNSVEVGRLIWGWNLDTKVANYANIRKERSGMKEKDKKLHKYKENIFAQDTNWGFLHR